MAMTVSSTIFGGRSGSDSTIRRPHANVHSSGPGDGPDYSPEDHRMMRLVRLAVGLVGLMVIVAGPLAADDATNPPAGTQPAPAAAAPAAAPAQQGPGCSMPGGGCCGSPECAQAAAPDKPAAGAAAGGCPCMKMRQAAQAADKPS